MTCRACALSSKLVALFCFEIFVFFRINGPYAALTSYLSEFHCAKHRARIQMMLGIVFSAGTVLLPLLAWTILPLNLNFTWFGDAVGKFLLYTFDLK